MKFFAKFSKAAGLLFAVSLLWLSGCSRADLPTASSAPPADPAAAGASIQKNARGFGIALVPPHLAKRTGRRTIESTSQMVPARRGGVLFVASGRTFASLLVPPGALEKNTRIDMTLVGEGAYSEVHFGPEGLQFLQPCTLSITFPADGVDPETLGGYLIEENGEAVPVEYKVTVRGGWITVTLAIHHFSIYSPGDGDDDDIPPEPDTEGGGSGGGG